MLACLHPAAIWNIYGFHRHGAHMSFPKDITPQKNSIVPHIYTEDELQVLCTKQINAAMSVNFHIAI